MAPVIDTLVYRGSHVSLIILAATAVAIVLCAVAHLVKAAQPVFTECQKTRRALAAEREQTLRTSSVTLDAHGKIVVTGPAALADPTAAAQALRQACEVAELRDQRSPEASGRQAQQV